MGAAADRAGDASVEPTRLRFVGPATAAVIERSPFNASDIRDASVSHRALIKAGVNAGVAERLRREYGLLWNFRWHPGGENLPRRAAKMRAASEAERRWIAASAENWNGQLPDIVGNGTEASDKSEFEFDIADWPEWPDIDEPDEPTDRLEAVLGDNRASASDCPRCGETMSRFEMGERKSVQCGGCGYVGVQLSSQTGAWRRAVERIVRGTAMTG